MRLVIMQLRICSTQTGAQMAASGPHKVGFPLPHRSHRRRNQHVGQIVVNPGGQWVPIPPITSRWQWVPIPLTLFNDAKLRSRQLR